jgi:hypothetical protein
VASAKTCKSLVEESLAKLQEAGVITIADEEIHITAEQRLRIAEIAVGIGADPERIARELRWQEFEVFVNQLLIRDGFETTNHFVFKSVGRRFEIDVLGAKEPMVICIDCKHWHHGWAPSKLTVAAENQLLRVRFLSQTFAICAKKLRATVSWKSARLLPVVVTLADLSSRVIDGVPVVSAFRFRDFLTGLNPWVEKLRFVEARICD